MMSSMHVGVTDINLALSTRAFPTITTWNRLEGRPRAANFDRALRAEVRDALWMLTRQWQMGEFKGDDAGSPVFARLRIATTRMNKYRPNGQAAEALDGDVPLEAKVEQRRIALSLAGQKHGLDIRLLMGQRWLKILAKHKVGKYQQEYIDKYSIKAPNAGSKQDALLCAHLETWQTFAAVAGRRMDGASLYSYLKDQSGRAADGINVSGPDSDPDKALLNQLGVGFVRWCEELYYQPPQAGEQVGNAWDPARLEYRFACSAPEAEGEKVLTAEAYYHGRLDWYNFDIDRASKGLGEVVAPAKAQLTDETKSFIPAPINFEGMPNTRWWAFEDQRTNFGDIKPDTTDLAKLLLMEFGLVYANDWFLIPCTLDAGTIASINGLAVTSVFGERFWIEAVGSGAGNAEPQWSMFTLAAARVGSEPADASLLLLATIPKVQESSPVEEVIFIRDEMANMVWGIEKTIPLASGGSKSGYEAAAETRDYYRELLAAQAGPDKRYKAPIRYQVMNTVPENWIPFIPVHVKDDNREIQLQRAAMPRILEGDSNRPAKVRPRTLLLREGLEHKPPSGYYLYEEEVPRGGVRITQSFQRTRWRDGSVSVWLGARKQTGRGEGSSAMAFDRIVDVEPPKTE